ncbi:unnamed protein product, partial [Polarella glacialis]
AAERQAAADAAGGAVLPTTTTTTITTTTGLPTTTTTTVLPILVCREGVSCRTFMRDVQKCTLNCTSQGAGYYAVSYMTCIYEGNSGAKLLGSGMCETDEQQVAPKSVVEKQFVWGAVDVWVETGGAELNADEATQAVAAAVFLKVEDIESVNVTRSGGGGAVAAFRRLQAELYNIQYVIKLWKMAQEGFSVRKADSASNPSGGTAADDEEITYDETRIAEVILARSRNIFVDGTNEQNKLKETFEDLFQIRSDQITVVGDNASEPKVFTMGSIEQVKVLTPDMSTKGSQPSQAATISMASTIIILMVLGCIFVTLVAICGRIQMRRIKKLEAEQQ